MLRRLERLITVYVLKGKLKMSTILIITPVPNVIKIMVINPVVKVTLCGEELEKGTLGATYWSILFDIVGSSNGSGAGVTALLQRLGRDSLKFWTNFKRKICFN